MHTRVSHPLSWLYGGCGQHRTHWAQQHWLDSPAEELWKTDHVLAHCIASVIANNPLMNCDLNEGIWLTNSPANYHYENLTNTKGQKGLALSMESKSIWFAWGVVHCSPVTDLPGEQTEPTMLKIDMLTASCPPSYTGNQKVKIVSTHFLSCVRKSSAPHLWSSKEDEILIMVFFVRRREMSVGGCLRNDLGLIHGGGTLECLLNEWSWYGSIGPRSLHSATRKIYHLEVRTTVVKIFDQISAAS